MQRHVSVLTAVSVVLVSALMNAYRYVAKAQDVDLRMKMHASVDVQRDIQRREVVSSGHVVSF